MQIRFDLKVCRQQSASKNSWHVYAKRKEMQTPTQERQQETNNSSVKPFWATQAPANRSTSPAAWLTEVRNQGSAEYCKESQTCELTSRFFGYARLRANAISISKSQKICRQRFAANISEPVCHNSSVKPFWATQAPANRSTSPAAWLPEVRDCTSCGMTTKKNHACGLK